MKKLICLSFLVISVAAFSNTYGYHNNYDNHHNGTHYNEFNLNLTQTQKRNLNSKQISIQEKKLELRKEMNSDQINWNKVETLNKEIAELKGQYHTEILKLREKSRV